MAFFKNLSKFLFGEKSSNNTDSNTIVTEDKIQEVEETSNDEPEEVEESEWISPSDETLEQIMVECFKLKQNIQTFEPHIDDEFLVKYEIQKFIDFLSAITGVEICWADVTDSYEDACIAAESSAGLSIIGYKANTKVIYMNQVITIPKLIDDDIHEFAYDVTE